MPYKDKQIRQEYHKKYIKENRHKYREGGLKYSRENRVSTSGGLATTSNAGEAGELLVGADLLTRGLSVTKPLNRTGSDDLHVKVYDGWKSVQVKVAKVNRRTGTIQKLRRERITSDITALVDLVGRRIRYIAQPGHEVPLELLDEVS